MKQIIYFIFGKRAEGEQIQQPSFKSTYPADRLSESEWSKLVKFGSRYGHRGSFYNTYRSC